MIKIRSNNIFFPFVFWTILLSIFFLTVLNLEGLEYAIKIIIAILLPVVVPVMLISIGFDRFYTSKKYIPLLIGIIIISGLFGYINTLWYKFILGSEAYSGTYAMIIFISAAYIGIKNIRINLIQKQKYALLESKQYQTELQFLKSQINPHFLFNSLNNLYGVSLQKPEQAPDLILKLSNLMRYVLESASKKYISLDKEIEYLENYIEFEKLRLSVPNNITFSVNSDVKDKMIAPMLLIPFVENSFKHGINSEMKEFNLKIVTQVINNSFIFNIENSIPNNESIDLQKLGFGLENIKRRLVLIYPDSHHLEISKNKMYFSVTLELKLNQ